MTDSVTTGALARPVRAVSSRVLLAAAAILVVAVLMAIAAILPLHRAAVLAAGIVWFVLPGIVMARVLYGAQPGVWIGSVLLGGVWGYAFSSLALLALWIAGQRGAWTLVVAPLLALPVALLLRPLAGRLRLPHFTRADVLAVLLLLLAVPLVVGRPFSLVGADLHDGRAYRAYFTADFVWRMAVVAEVSKGDVPPQNQYLIGEPLRYYWLPHLLPALQHALKPPQVRLEQILLLQSIVLNLVFVGFLYAFTRQLVSSPVAAALGCLGAVFFTSFEGIERIWFHLQRGHSLELLRNINIDAVSRWFYQSLPIDGLHRLLLYQPHHSMGYAAGLSALLAATQAREVARPGPMLWIGTLLATSLLLSSFAALMFTTMAAIYLGIRLVSERRFVAMVPSAIVAAIPLTAALALAYWLQYVDPAETLVTLGLNRMAARNVPQALVLSFGPMLVGGLVGLWMATRRNAPYADIFGTIVGISILFYFFVDVVDHQRVYVGWRAGHFMFVAFAGLAGYALQELFRRGHLVRVVTAVVATVLALAAIPTIAIDLYNTQDVANRVRSPGGFPWTLVLAPEEVEALDWIKRATRPGAIVQVEPTVRGQASWAYVPAFAERRMAAGLPISMVPLARYRAASDRVRELYAAPDAATAHERALALRIDYLMIGPPEHAAYPELQAMLDERPDLFPPALRNRLMAIYSVSR